MILNLDGIESMQQREDATLANVLETQESFDSDWWEIR